MIMENFGMMIPTKLFQPLEEKKYATIDDLMKDAYNKYRWCNGDRCACMGCVNNLISINGFTKEQWEEWVKLNPDTSEKEAGFGFKSYTYENK